MLDVRVVLVCLVLAGQAVDSSEGPPPAPTVHCWCSRYPNATFCTWPEPSHSPPTHYIATYRERHKHAVTKNCLLTPPGSFSNTTGAPASEQLWLCHLPDLKLLTDYIINITAVRGGGSSSLVKSFMMEDIVKPDPPVHVRASPHSSKRLLVQWSPPPTWSSLDIFPLKYQILYQWQVRGSTKSVKLGPFENTKVELKGLIPGRLYSFQVCAKEMLGLGECSDWSPPVQITKQ